MDDAEDRLFLAWEQAVIDLRLAERSGGSLPEILRLAAEVTRSRNAFTLEQGRSGEDAHDRRTATGP